MLRVYKGEMYTAKSFSAQIITDTSQLSGIAKPDFVVINGIRRTVNSNITQTVGAGIVALNVSDLCGRTIRIDVSSQWSISPYIGGTIGTPVLATYDAVEDCYSFEFREDSPIIQSFDDNPIEFWINNSSTIQRISVFNKSEKYQRFTDSDFYKTVEFGYDRVLIRGIQGVSSAYLMFKAPEDNYTITYYAKGYTNPTDSAPSYANGFYYLSIPSNTWYAEIKKTNQAQIGESFEINYISVNADCTAVPNFEYFDDFLSAEVIEEKKILSDDLPIDCFNAEFYADEGETLSLSVGDKLTLVSNDNVFGRFTIKTVERTYAGTYQVVAYNKFYELDNIPFYGQEKLYWQMTDRTDLGVTEKGINSYFADIGVDIDTSAIYWQGGESIGLTGYVPANSVRYFVCALAYAHNKFITIDRESEKITLESLLASTSGLTIPYIHNYEDLDDPTNNVEKIIGEATFERQNLGRGSWSYGYVSTSEEFEEFKTNIELDGNGNGKIYVFGGKDNPKYCWLDYKTQTKPYIVLWESHFATVIQSTQNATITVKLYDTKTETQTLLANANAVGEAYSLDKFGCVGYINERDEDPFFTPVDRIEVLSRYTNNHGKVMAKIIIDKAHPEKVGDYVKIQTAHDGDKYGYITKMHTMFGYDDVADIEVETYYTS